MMNRRLLLLSGMASTAVLANLSGCASPTVKRLTTLPLRSVKPPHASTMPVEYVR